MRNEMSVLSYLAILNKKSTPQLVRGDSAVQELTGSFCLRRQDDVVAVMLTL